MQNNSGGFYGDVILSGGSLEPGSTLFENSFVTLSADDALKLSASLTTLGSFGGTGDLQLNGNLSLGNDNSNSAYSGSLSGTGTLTKVGVGTWTFTGNHTGTGAVTVSAGTPPHTAHEHFFSRKPNGSSFVLRVGLL